MTRPEEEGAVDPEGVDDETLADEGRDAGLAGAFERSRGAMMDMRDCLEGVVTDGGVARCA